MYVAHMQTIMNKNFSNGWYKTRIHEIQSIIDAEVQADPNKFYTYDDFFNNIENAVGAGCPPGHGNQGGIVKKIVSTDCLIFHLIPALREKMQLQDIYKYALQYPLIVHKSMLMRYSD